MTTPASNAVDVVRAVSTGLDFLPRQASDTSDTCTSGGALCQWLLDLTGNTTAAEFAEWFLDKPLRLVGVLIVTWIANKSSNGRCVGSSHMSLLPTAQEHLIVSKSCAFLGVGCSVMFLTMIQFSKSVDRREPNRSQMCSVQPPVSPCGASASPLPSARSASISHR